MMRSGGNRKMEHKKNGRNEKKRWKWCDGTQK